MGTTKSPVLLKRFFRITKAYKISLLFLVWTSCLKMISLQSHVQGKFMSQPFHVAEVFTGTSGKFVSLEDSITGFEQIINGEHDDVPEGAFYMVGDIKEVLEKAKSMST